MTTAILKSDANSWTLRLFTLLVWLLVGLCTAYWAFKFVTTTPVEATAALATPTVVVDSKAIAKLLGATDNVAKQPATIAAASTKFVLFGLAATAGGKGYALIALDGKPARPYRVGSLVADDLVLKSISKTGVVLAASLTADDGVSLELPERKPINTTAIAALNQIAIPPASPPASTLPAPPRFPAMNPNNAVPTVAPVLPLAISPNQPPAAQPGRTIPGAAAAISRFAPQVSSQMSDGQAPVRPPTATSSASEAER
jgi:general secretion pathway protein C